MKMAFGGQEFCVVFCLVSMTVISCKSQPEVVTKTLYNQLGQERFSQFRFFVSQDVVLREVVPTDNNAVRDNARVRTVYNNTVNIKRSTPGRVQGNATDEKLEIAFEALKDGTKPPISFIQKRNDGKYYFEFTVEDWLVTDKAGRYSTVHGPGIQYNGKIYLLEFKKKGEPYLQYDLDVKVTKSSKNMKGLK